jgi:serine/threonine protein kinase
MTAALQGQGGGSKMIGRIVGSYKITEKIGEGGMGTVFKGIDTMLEREVAIKMLRPDLTRDAETAERFRAEAITLAKLNHPNIATLHNFFRHDEDYFMVMEFMRGETIEGLIKKHGALPPDRAVFLFGQALEAIGQAHTMGIIHRDIKPANMMFTEKGFLKVMDFGIARVLGTTRMTRQGTTIGTIEYMAPEQIQGLDCDSRTDIYSLGILLYEMVTGRVPFKSDSEFGLMMAQINDSPPPPRTIDPHIPLHIEQAIMRSLAKNPEARFQTVGEFRMALVATFVPSPVGRDNLAATAPRVAGTTAAISQETLRQESFDKPSSASRGTMPNQTSGNDPRRDSSQAAPPPAPSGAQVIPDRDGSHDTGNAQINRPAPQFSVTPSKGLNGKYVAVGMILLVVLAGVPLYFLNSGKEPVPTKDALTQPPPTKPEPQTPAQTIPALQQEKPADPQNSQPDTVATGDSDTDKAAAAEKAKARREAAAARERERKRKEARKLLDS